MEISSSAGNSELSYQICKRKEEAKKNQKVYTNDHGIGQVTEINNKGIEIILFKTGMKETDENTIGKMINDQIDTMDYFKLHS